MKRFIRFSILLFFICFMIVLNVPALLFPVKALPTPLQTNPIVREDQKPGTTSWLSPALKKALQQEQISADDGTSKTPIREKQTQKPATVSKQQPFMQTTTASKQQLLTQASTLAPTDVWTDTSLRGYAGATSINKGQAINFYIGTTLPSYSIQFYRMGWYGGSGAHMMLTVNNLQGQNQAIPLADPNTGLLQLNWNVSYTLQTDSTWTTGAYLAELIGSDGTINYIPFVVRDDSSTADIVYQLAVNTYQAYNDWGGQACMTTIPTMA